MQKQNNTVNDNIDKELNKILEIYKIKYTDIQYLDKGTFNKVYLIINNNIKFIIKYQNLKNEKNLLYYEYLLLSNTLTNDNYVVNLYNINNKSYYCKKDEYVFLCQEYLYQTLSNKKKEYTFNINEILDIGNQLIKIIEYIHSKKYLYIDLKPDNIMFINNTDLKIKLIDFNLCDKYIDSYSNFYSNDKINTRKGNDIFSSRNINSSHRGQRFDDIESILYILLYLLEDETILNLYNKKNINNIINDKETLFISKNSKYQFINLFINEIKTNIIVDNKKPNYKKFITILSN
jgi:serine/threonine protein kinase